jgi:hypothetical protein
LWLSHRSVVPSQQAQLPTLSPRNLERTLSHNMRFLDLTRKAEVVPPIRGYNGA